MSEEKKDNVMEFALTPEQAQEVSERVEAMTEKSRYAQEKEAKRKAREAKAQSTKLQREAGLPVTRGEFVVIMNKSLKAHETTANHEVLFTYLLDSGVITETPQEPLVLAPFPGEPDAPITVGHLNVVIEFMNAVAARTHRVDLKTWIAEKEKHVKAEQLKQQVAEIEAKGAEIAAEKLATAPTSDFVN